jgi:alkanesulfonate monooxygenase SsuD/methylene tetrahydromethanopterin reductase-like flavin-dependent oxidoreductase (luciferase family)
MQVSLACAIRNHPAHPRPLTEIYDNFLSYGTLAEELGFCRVWLSEHHLAEDNWNASPVTVLAALAARTRTIRLGTYVLLLPLHHPLKVAEEIATLDILSHGRFDFAVAAGPMEVECTAFGVNKAETFARTYEALAVIERFMTEESVTHHGKYYHFDNIAMTTKPVQKPMPPIYTTPLFGAQSWERSAQRGYNVASALHSPIWLQYPKMLEKHGHDRSKVRIVSGPVFAHVADSRDKAWDEAEESLHWAMEFYRLRGLPFPVAPVGEFRKPQHALAYNLPIAAGSPDEVLQTLSAYKDLPLDELAIAFDHPGLDLPTIERSLRRFAREVMPEIKRWGAQR